MYGVIILFMIKFLSMNTEKIFHDELNFRDLGGYETLDHRKVKKNLFYRSASLSWFTDTEREAFQQLGIKYILDLRTKDEAAKMPDPILDGTEIVRHSGVVSKGGEEIDFSPKGMSQIGSDGKNQYEMLMQYYQNMPFGNEAFHVLLNKIDQNQLPICFHCATGKDRTGVAAMIILLLLNVDEQTVLDDYMLSNQYREKTIKKLFNENKQLAEDEYGRKLLMMRAGVLEETGRNVLNAIKRKCGSYDHYFLMEYGYDAKKLNSFRSRFTE